MGTVTVVVQHTQLLKQLRFLKSLQHQALDFSSRNFIMDPRFSITLMLFLIR